MGIALVFFNAFFDNFRSYFIMYICQEVDLFRQIDRQQELNPPALQGVPSNLSAERKVVNVK